MGVQRDLGSVLDAIGDALDIRQDEERRDAQEELAEFRQRTFPTKTNHTPTSGRGNFDAAFDPSTGRLLITLKVGYDFVSGDPTRVAPGFRRSEFDWTPQEERTWKAQYQRDVEAQWSDRHRFRSTKPHWSSMVVDVSIDVVENNASPHYKFTISKYPPDADMVVSSVCPAGFHHGPGNTCPANPAGETHGTGEFDSNDLRPEPKLDAGNSAVQITFGTGESDVSASDRATLAFMAMVMRINPNSNARVTGRANNVRPAGVSAADGAIANMDLARQRSAAVSAILEGAGVPSDRIHVRNHGDQGATDDASWRRVDVQLGSQETQSPLLHETGHMLGLGDEYGTSSSPTGTGIDASYQAMLTNTTGDVITRGATTSAMSMGSTVERWHYAPFLEVLRDITGMTEWGL